MKRKIYFLSITALFLLFFNQPTYSQGLLSAGASPSEGCAPFRTMLIANHPNTQYFEWSIDGQIWIGREVNYIFTRRPFVFVAAYDTTGGKKNRLEERHVWIDLGESFSVSVSKDTVCVNERLYVSGTSLSKVDFGDGTVISDDYAKHSYTKPGIYTITAIGETRCRVIFETAQTIVVKNDLLPRPDFRIWNTTVCPTEPVSFSAHSEFSKYLWNFGDGTISNESYVSHSWRREGVYKISLTETNSCGLTNTVVKSITIANNKKIYQPSVDISLTEACPNTNIRFNIRNNEAYKSVLLDFGDNKTTPAKEENNHIYTKAGRYFPKLIVTNYCDFDSTIFLDTITIRSNLRWSDQDYIFKDWPWSVCPREPFEYGVYDDKVVSYLWAFGDGETSTTRSGNYAYSTVGIQNIKLTMTNGCGADTTISGTIDASSNKSASNFDVDVPLSVVCPGDTVFLITSNSHLKDYNWNFGDGTISNSSYGLLIKKYDSKYNLKYATHAYKMPGEYLVKVEFSNYCGNKGIDSLIITVKNNLMEDSDLYRPLNLDYPATTCEPIKFFKNGGKSYSWDFGDGSAKVSTTQSIVSHSFKQAGIYDVSLAITNSCGSSFTATDRVKVIDECVTGLGDADETNDLLSVSPNPIAGVSIISINSASTTPAQIFVVNGFGTKISIATDVILGEENRMVLDARNLKIPAGIYMLCVEQEGKLMSTKIAVIE